MTLLSTEGRTDTGRRTDKGTQMFFLYSAQCYLDNYYDVQYFRQSVMIVQSLMVFQLNLPLRLKITGK